LLQYLFRFLVGGTIVSLFACLGDVLKPKSFAGLFGAAPSVALTLGLTIFTEGKAYAALEARSTCTSSQAAREPLKCGNGASLLVSRMQQVQGACGKIRKRRRAPPSSASPSLCEPIHIVSGRFVVSSFRHLFERDYLRIFRAAVCVLACCYCFLHLILSTVH
jgi:hypothetical protein